MWDSKSKTATSTTEWAPRFDDHRIGKDEAKLAWRAAGSGEGRYAVARVETVAEDGMVVLLPEPLVAGQTVWIREKPADRVASVLSCIEQAVGYRVSLTVKPLERRREFRLLAGGCGRLSWTGPNGRKSARVSVRDMTDSGMKLDVPERLEANQHIRLSGEAWECQGIVRYCRLEGGGFVAGVELTRPPYPKDCLEYQD
ncbi:MAG: hypothetical protein HY238_04180 [Acidobacteria bacterium]|nr:hypothetical protein [Acidobacteriota bacterium]